MGKKREMQAQTQSCGLPVMCIYMCKTEFICFTYTTFSLINSLISLILLQSSQYISPSMLWCKSHLTFKYNPFTMTVCVKCKIHLWSASFSRFCLRVELIQGQIKPGFGNWNEVTVIIWDARIVCLCGGSRRRVVTVSDWRAFYQWITGQHLHTGLSHGIEVRWCRVKEASRFSSRLLFAQHMHPEKNQSFFLFNL